MTTPKVIIFSKNQTETLKKHSEQNVPNEACAILFGNNTNDEITIKEIFLTKNIEKSPVNFTISNEELIETYEKEKEMNLKVSGIFHSHPDSAPYPSPTDKKYMEINDVPWVIFSNINDEFKAYIYNSGIVPVPVKIL
ncbi:MAG: Mov34/MPN/PAD-1 family protein [Nitrosotalea sp.]